MKKLTSWITIILFFGFLVGVAAAGYILPDHAVSTAESRTLTQRPVNDLTDLKTLTQNWTDYVVDQFPGREQLLKLYSGAELAQGKWYVRNSYVIDSQWLMTKVYPVPENKLERLAAALESATAACPAEFVYTVIPQKNEALPELGVRFRDPAASEQNRAQLCAMLAEQDVLAVNVAQHWLDTYDLQARMQLYFKTDFHWNADGAFRAADYIENQMRAAGVLPAGIDVDASDFLWTDLSAQHTYQGDLNRRFSNLFSTQEYIPCYTCRDTDALRYYPAVDAQEPVPRTQIIGAELTETMLSYNGMFTENLGYFRVENPNAATDQRVLILKDSYQNPTTDFFSQVFAQVHVIDPRSYTEPYTLPQLVEQQQIDVVLFLYHQNNVSDELIAFLEMR